MSVTIKLTNKDSHFLAFMLGKYSAMSEELSVSEKEMIDWLIVQMNSSNYTYFNDKPALIGRKTAELAHEERK